MLSERTIVLVSVRNKKVLGLIIKNVSKPKNNFIIKTIEKEYLDKVLSKNIISFYNWLKHYYYLNAGQALKLFLPNQKIIELTKSKILYITYKKHESDLTVSENNILKFLYNNPKTKIDIFQKFKSKKSLIDTLKKKELVLEKEDNSFVDSIDIKKLFLKELTRFQKEAYKKIKVKISEKNKKPIFLDGVTGSGKTEVYFKLIGDFLKLKKQVLVMIPEIALSEQWLERFRKSFGFYPLVWNSKVKLSKKRKIWNTALTKQPFVLVGARSSLFLPYLNLGLIIIDEENDQSYKQEEGVIYNARDMAVVKAKIEKTSIILVSATPSLETYKNCKEKKYSLVKINKRFQGVSEPKIKVIDMKKYKSKLISDKLELELNNNLKQKKQSLILINRRGYAPVSLCSKCGIKRQCKNCDASLVYHKESDVLICHQCGRKELTEGNCIKCDSDKFILVGVGLEKVFEEVNKIFKSAKVIKLSSDSLDKENFGKTLKHIEESKVDIIVGTQIISKGFDFENLKSVFIIDFDTWFNNADIRTNEKVFQLTQQIAGRAGRRKERGEVFIQTYQPKNKLLNDIIKNNRDLFYDKELKIRKKSLLPPYSKLLLITISSQNLRLAEEKAKEIKCLFNGILELKVLGPIPAQIFYVNKKYRFRLLIKAESPLIIQNYLVSKNFVLNTDAKIKIKFDIDPYNLY